MPQVIHNERQEGEELRADNMPRQLVDSLYQQDSGRRNQGSSSYQLKNQILRTNSELEAQEEFVRSTKGNHLLPIRAEERLPLNRDIWEN